MQAPVLRVVEKVDLRPQGVKRARVGKPPSGYARLASRHHCGASFGFALVVLRTRARRAMAT
jgi:hypothetical protein